MSKKKPGIFDDMASDLDQTADDHMTFIRNHPGPVVRRQFGGLAKTYRLAARLLRIAGRADIIGDEQDELCLYDIIKIARIILRAQKLQEKSK